MAIECYFISGSPFAWRAMLGLAFKGLDFEQRVLQASEGEHKTPEFLAMNPHGKVPVLKDGDLTIYESLAILAYLDRKYPEKPLFGETAADAALIWQRTMEFETIMPNIVPGMVRPIFSGTVEGNEASINERIVDFRAEFDRYEGWLEAGGYMAGDSLSAVDISVYPVAAIASRVLGSYSNDKLNLDFFPLRDSYPRIAAWMTRVEAMPGFEAVYPPHWKAQKAAE